jgi:hypothetical protein
MEAPLEVGIDRTLQSGVEGFICRFALNVIPAQAGIQGVAAAKRLDPGLRRGDKKAVEHAKRMDRGRRAEQGVFGFRGFGDGTKAIRATSKGTL